jgi:hypothetical protein
LVICASHVENKICIPRWWGQALTSCAHKSRSEQVDRWTANGGRVLQHTPNGFEKLTLWHLARPRLRRRHISEGQQTAALRRRDSRRNCRRSLDEPRTRGHWTYNFAKSTSLALLRGTKDRHPWLSAFGRGVDSRGHEAEHVSQESKARQVNKAISPWKYLLRPA